MKIARKIFFSNFGRNVYESLLPHTSPTHVGCLPAGYNTLATLERLDGTKLGMRAELLMGAAAAGWPTAASVVAACCRVCEVDGGGRADAKLGTADGAVLAISGGLEHLSMVMSSVGRQIERM